MVLTPGSVFGVVGAGRIQRVIVSVTAMNLSVDRVDGKSHQFLHDLRHRRRAVLVLQRHDHNYISVCMISATSTGRYGTDVCTTFWLQQPNRIPDTDSRNVARRFNLVKDDKQRHEPRAADVRLDQPQAVVRRLVVTGVALWGGTVLQQCQRHGQDHVAKCKITVQDL